MELRMLAEHFVDGAEYSVEMLLRGGAELFSNITGKRLFPGPRPVESAHVVPAEIAPATAAQLTGQTLRLLRAIGFRDGIVHCEWIVSDGEPYLVECAGRMAGDGIIELIENAYAVELKRDYVAVMKGEPLPDAPLPRHAARAAAARFMTIEPGTVTAVRGVEDAAKAEGVVMCDVSVAPGDRCDGLRCSWDRVADLMVTAATSAEALRLADAAAAMIEIDVRPDAATVTGPRAGVVGAA
jgi:biotin carboxylase